MSDMSAERFFRPDGTPAREAWDGTPQVMMSFDQASYLINTFCPHWHLHMLGPVPFGQTERWPLHIKGICRGTRAEVEAMAWDWARRACEEFGHVFHSEDWSVEDILMVNGD